jgi:hypothetical protein
MKAALDKAAYIDLGRVNRHSRHRNSFSTAHLARGESDFANIRDDASIFFKRLVEVAELEEEDCAWMLELQP